MYVHAGRNTLKVQAYLNMGLNVPDFIGQEFCRELFPSWPPIQKSRQSEKSYTASYLSTTVSVNINGCLISAICL